MAQLQVNKEAFEGYLDQFEGDAQYQAILIKRILTRMPQHVKETLLEELYFANVFKGDYYVAVHCVFKDDVHYFPNLDTLKEFLKGRSRTTDPEAIDRLSDRIVVDHLKRDRPLFGYFVSKGER